MSWCVVRLCVHSWEFVDVINRYWGGGAGDLKWFGLCDRLTYFVFYELFVSVYALLCLYLCEDHIGCIIRVRIFLRQETIFPQCLFQTWLRL